MDNKEAQEKFRQADKLYRARQYPQALVILDELNEAFPETRHVMFPRARCLAKLDRQTEAMYLLREVVDKYKYAPAEELLNYLSVLQTTPLESDPPAPPDEPEDGGLGEHPAEENSSSASATSDTENPFAALPLPAAAAKPDPNVLEPIPAPLPTADIPGVPPGEMPSVSTDGLPDLPTEAGLLDNLHGEFDANGLPLVDPETIPIDEDLFAKGKPGGIPTVEEEKPSRSWGLIIGVPAIILAVAAFGIYSSMVVEPKSPDEVAEVVSAPQQPAATTEPAPRAEADAPTTDPLATPAPTPPATTVPAGEDGLAYPGEGSDEVLFPDGTWTKEQILAWDEAIYEWPEEKQLLYQRRLALMREGDRRVLDARINLAYEWQYEQNKPSTGEVVAVGLGVGIGAFVLSIVLSIVLWTILCILWQPIPIYLTLVIRDNTPSDDILHNIMQVLFCCVIMGVLMGVLRLGYFIGMAAIGKQFDWEPMDYLIYVLLSAAMAGVYVAIILSLLPPEFWDLMQNSPTGF